MIEERNGSGYAIKQYVWGLTYIDELCQIMIAASASTPNYPFYVMQDANYNVIGVASRTGRLVERYEYTPYGQRTVFTKGFLPADVNDDGRVGLGDLSVVSSNYGMSGATLAQGDINGDGIIDVIDLGLVTTWYDKSVAYSNDPLCMSPVVETYRLRSGSITSPYGLCDIGHQGLMHDKEFGLVYNRARYLHPTLGRFMQRDPLGYVDGMSVYEYVRSGPTAYVDPEGLWKGRHHAALTRRAMEERGYSTEDIKHATEANKRVDRLSNQVNNKEHYMPGHGEEAEAAITEKIGKAAQAAKDGDQATAMKYLGEAMHIAQDKAAHYDQNAGWLAHLPLLGSSPDNPDKHPDNYQDAETYSDNILDRFENTVDALNKCQE
jgi:RHS repeat-associated protein